MTTSTSRPDLNIRIIFICCIATVAIAFGIRQGFGLFMRPITLDMGWSREALAATFATQSIGQIVLIPVSQHLIAQFDWRVAVLVLAVLAAITVPLAFVIARTTDAALSNRGDQTLRDAINEARSHRGYVLLLIGFFVCGFHVQFIAIHLPAYISDQGLGLGVAATALMIIAVGNAGGSWLSGWLSDRFRKRNILSSIYAARAVLFAIFIAVPISEVSVFAFSAVLGFLWLSTVPLTSSIVAQVFGPRYMATLYAFVFMSHQMGSFVGVWTGGYLFDITGSYQSVWLITIALGLGASLIHIFIDDQPIARVAMATGEAQRA